MSLEDTSRCESINESEMEKLLDEFYDTYIKLQRAYSKKYKKYYDISVVIKDENNITIINNHNGDKIYTYYYRED
jgi:hypothetical protein